MSPKATTQRRKKFALKKTAKALAEYDRFQASIVKLVPSLTYQRALELDEREEELRKALATAFSEETGNNLDTCLKVIYPGPELPRSAGERPSFVRQMVKRSLTCDTNWNPRYLQYARVHGQPDPDKMLEKDRKTYPGGCMMGFSFWIQKKWKQWYRKCDKECTAANILYYYHSHEEFDLWLSKETS